MRQLIVLDWFYRRYLEHLPRSSIIKYEEVVASQGRVLSVVTPAASALAEPLDSQNTSKLYDYEKMARLGERLLATDGAYWQLFDRASVESLLADIRRAQLPK